MNRAIVTLVVSATLLSACSARAGYPSLARRPGELINAPVSAPPTPERIAGSAPVAAATDAPLPVKPLPLELQSRLLRLLEQARAAHARFSAATASTSALVSAAEGSAVASESWSRATVALATLESRRSDVMVALGDLDSLYVKDRTDGGETAEIAQVRDSVTAWVGDEDAVLANLRGRIAG